MEREPQPIYEDLFQEAIEHFPYPDLSPTSITQGTVEPDESGEIQYAEEFVFEAGKLLKERLLAGGSIELRRDETGALHITAMFGVARNGDWKQGAILPEGTAIQGVYQPETQSWELWIGQY